MADTTNVAPDLVKTWMETGGALLVDVRDDYEHAEERIDGAVLRPLSAFEPEALRNEAGDRRVVFHCRSGKRSQEAADRFCREGEATFQLAGGIEGWKAAGMPVIRSASAPKLPIMRQVQISAGAMVAAGVGLGVTVSPWFLAIAGFVGCGLMFAGLTGWCGLAKLLAVMPWNRALRQAGAAASCCSA